MAKKKKRIRRIRITYKRNGKKISYLRRRKNDKARKKKVIRFTKKSTSKKAINILSKRRKKNKGNKLSKKEQKRIDKLNKDLDEAQIEDEFIRKVKEDIERAKKIIAEEERDKRSSEERTELIPSLIKISTLSFLFQKDLDTLLNSGKFLTVNGKEVSKSLSDIYGELWKIDDERGKNKYPVIDYIIDIQNRSITWTKREDLDKEEIADWFKYSYKRNKNKRDKLK